MRPGGRTADSGILLQVGTVQRWWVISNAEQACNRPFILRGDGGLFPGEFADLLQYKITLLPLCVVNPLIRCLTEVFCPILEEEISL